MTGTISAGRDLKEHGLAAQVQWVAFRVALRIAAPLVFCRLLTLNDATFV
jgi:hypothetical protein